MGVHTFAYAQDGDLEKLGEQSRALGRAMARGQAKAFEEHERQQERMAGIMSWQSEKAAVPVEIRDALVKLQREIAEMRVDEAKQEAEAIAHRRWMLLMTAAILVLTAVLVLDLLR